MENRDVIVRTRKLSRWGAMVFIHEFRIGNVVIHEFKEISVKQEWIESWLLFGVIKLEG